MCVAVPVAKLGFFSTSPAGVFRSVSRVVFVCGRRFSQLSVGDLAADCRASFGALLARV